MNDLKHIIFIGEDGSMKGYNKNAFMSVLNIHLKEYIKNKDKKESEKENG